MCLSSRPCRGRMHLLFPHFLFFCVCELGRCIFSEVDSGLKLDFCQSTSAFSFEQASVSLSVKMRRGWARTLVPEVPGCLRDALDIP